MRVNPELPILPTDIDPTILHSQINDLVSNITSLHAELNVLKYGIVRDSPTLIFQALSEDIEELRTLPYKLRDEKLNYVNYLNKLAKPSITQGIVRNGIANYLYS